MTNQGKTYVRRLTPEQVQEIRSLHYQGKSDYWIAQSLDVARSTVTRVTHRIAYRNIPDVDGGSPEMCPCLKHTESRLRQVNLNSSRAAEVKAVCLACQRESIATVGDIQSAEGRFICDPCRRQS